MDTDIYATRHMGDRQMNMDGIDDRYITEEYNDGIRITMNKYKEWVDENGEPQVFHKTDKKGFISPLIKKESFEI